MNLTDTERAYLAGLFDGEGSVGYYFKTKAGYHLASLTISNSDPRVMRWIQQRITFGNLCNNGIKNRHYTWQWTLTSKNHIREFLTLIRPYLVVKADQVDLLFSLWDAEQKEGCRPGKRLSEEMLGQREFTMNELKRLKTANFQSIH